MSIENSPMFELGAADGMADNQREADGQDPIGPQPPFLDYPVMYMTGYRMARG